MKKMLIIILMLFFVTRCGKNPNLDLTVFVDSIGIDYNKEAKEYTYSAKIQLVNGGNYGYTFRVMPKHEMLLDSANLNLVKWIVQ